MTIIIGVVIIILLVISLIPNYQAMKLAKNQGQKPTRYNYGRYRFNFNRTHRYNINFKMNS